MKLEILGSGGALISPRPFCECDQCNRSRAVGNFHHRLGPSVFLHDRHILFDTPEEIAIQLNRSNITRVDSCFYSHWHPDHTMGRRVWEHKRICKTFQIPNPTRILLPENTVAGITGRLAIMDHLRYFESQGLISIEIISVDSAVEFDGISVTTVPLADRDVSAFLLKQIDKRVLLIMDEHLAWVPKDECLYCDLLIMPIGIMTKCPWTGSDLLPPNHPILGVEATLDDTVSLIKTLQPKKVVLIHVEEAAGIRSDQIESLEGILTMRSGVEVCIGYDQQIVTV